jgi:hypothetical protein
MERTEPSDLKVHFCQEFPPQFAICSGEPSLALCALTLAHRFEAWLLNERAELTGAAAVWSLDELLREPPDDPPDEPPPEAGLPSDPFPCSPGFAPGVPLSLGFALAEGDAGGPLLTGGDAGGTPPGQFGAGAPGFVAPDRWFAADDTVS